MPFSNKKGVTCSVISIGSVIVDVENGRRKSITRSLQEFVRENVKYVYIADYLELIILSTSVLKNIVNTPKQPNE